MTQTIPPPPDDEPTNVLEPPPPGEPPPSRRLGWGLLLGVLVLVAVAAAAIAAYFAGRDGSSDSAATTVATRPAPTTTATLLPAGRVIVPDVTGLQENAAAARLGSAQLTPKVQTKATPKPTGIVVAQMPPGGKQTRKGGTVTIVVDRGAPSVAVPALTGVTAATAVKRLADAGLKAQTTQVTAAKPAGTVVSQAPPAGKKLKRGSVVTLSVARRKPAAAKTTTVTTTAATTTTSPPTSTAQTTQPQPASATVPDLSGTDVQAASQALARANLRASIAYVPGTDPLGTVEQQEPSAGSTAKPMSHVTVNASGGPHANQQETVPNTVGQTLDRAVSTLNGAGLRLIFVKVPTTSRAAVGTIVEQTPLPGKTAPKNAQVLVYLGVLRPR